MCCTRQTGNTGRKNDAKKSPSAHHHTTSSGYIFATKAYIYRQSEKNLLSSNISPTCPHNMVNFGPLAVSRLGSITAWHSSSGHQPNFAALNRGRLLYSAGRPSRWALAHILVVTVFQICGTLEEHLLTYLLTYMGSPVPPPPRWFSCFTFYCRQPLCICDFDPVTNTSF